MELVIGTKKWSSWSMRPWLVARRAGFEFAETLVELRQGEATEAQILPHSPSGLVPALKDGELVVWDSLAICEYLALARAAAAEMHAGFSSLRGECPMALDEPPKAVTLSEATGKDIRRIVRLWNDLLSRFGGPFLAGEWSIADAFYTPVATRFRTYGVKLSDYGDAGPAGEYAERLLEQPEFLAWAADAR
jgi:glutathione S-transferase